MHDDLLQHWGGGGRHNLFVKCGATILIYFASFFPKCISTRLYQLHRSGLQRVGKQTSESIQKSFGCFDNQVHHASWVSTPQPYDCIIAIYENNVPICLPLGSVLGRVRPGPACGNPRHRMYLTLHGIQIAICLKSCQRRLHIALNTGYCGENEGFNHTPIMMHKDTLESL